MMCPHAKSTETLKIVASSSSYINGKKVTRVTFYIKVGSGECMQKIKTFLYVVF